MARARDTKTGLTDGAPPRRQGKPFHRASKTARAAVTRIAGARGFAEADVLLRWAEIAGAELAPKCRPVKVSYGSRKALGATLVVHTDSGRAPEVEHLGPRILERVNSFYGYKAVSRLRITQTGPTGFAEEQAAFDGPSAEPGPREIAAAQALTQDIQSDGLRAALTRMGSHVLARTRHPHISDD